MLFLSTLLAAAASLARPEIAAARTTTPPVLDGRLDDAVWQTAIPTDAFTQRFPRQGDAPTERTVMRVLYDDDALYVAFDCEQVATPIVARLTRRDRPIDADRVSFSVDSRSDGTTAFDFSVNVAGVLADSIRYNDTEISPDWDDNWDARTSRTPRGWSAEFKIPLRVLRFRDLPVHSWGFQARRFLSLRQEEDLWAFIPRETAREVSAYGRLTELAGIRPSHSVELRPYVLGRVRRTDASTDSLERGFDATATAGIDLKWHPTQDLTLDVSANPDFAQVEADQVVLNLTPQYEVFLPERRPFFLEGTDIFTTPLKVFYTRRVGRVPPSPALRTEAPYGEKLATLPSPATLYGASKLIGRIAPKWSIGIVNAVSARSDVDVGTRDGSRVRRTAEPLTGFNVLRVKRDLGKSGHIGLLATSTMRAEDTAGYVEADPSPTGARRILCPSGSVQPLGARCFHNAHVAGVDWRWRSPAGNYVFSGQAIASAIQNGPPRTFADGTVLKSGDIEPGLQLRAAKDGGKPWGYEAWYTAAGKRLDYNDIGYLQRQNLHDAWGGISYRTVDPWWRTVTTEAYVTGGTRWSMDGLDLGQSARIGAWWQFDNFWEAWAQVTYKAAWFDDRETGDGAALERAGRLAVDAYVSTDPRKALRFELDTTTEKVTGGMFARAEAVLTLRTLPELDLQLLPQAVYADGEPRYAAAGASPGQYIFGSFHAVNVGGTLRATYTFTPRLSFQTYAQIFLASGHYDNFLSFQSDPAAPRPRIRRRDLSPSAPPAADPDFVDAALNINAVLRWEYRLGSTFFLVYSRAQSPRIDRLPGQAASLDLTAIGRAPAADVLLAKLAYWWG